MAQMWTSVNFRQGCPYLCISPMNPWFNIPNEKSYLMLFENLNARLCIEKAKPSLVALAVSCAFSYSSPKMEENQFLNFEQAEVRGPFIVCFIV